MNKPVIAIPAHKHNQQLASSVIMIDKKTFKQFTGYIINGCFASAAHYSILILLVEIFKVNPISATSVGFCVGLVIAYTLNSKYVFSNWNVECLEAELRLAKKLAQKKHVTTFGKYLILATTGISINTSLLWLLLKFTPLHYLLAQVIATLIVVFWNFTFCKLWVFKEQQ